MQKWLVEQEAAAAAIFRQINTALQNAIQADCRLIPEARTTRPMDSAQWEEKDKQWPRATTDAVFATWDPQSVSVVDQATLRRQETLNKDKTDYQGHRSQTKLPEGIKQRLQKYIDEFYHAMRDATQKTSLPALQEYYSGELADVEAWKQQLGYSAPKKHELKSGGKSKEILEGHDAQIAEAHAKLEYLFT